LTANDKFTPSAERAPVAAEFEGGQIARRAMLTPVRHLRDEIYVVTANRAGW